MQESRRNICTKAKTLVQILLNYIAFVHVLQLYLTRTSYGHRLYGIPSRIHNGRITNINSSIRSKAVALYKLAGKLLRVQRHFLLFSFRKYDLFQVHNGLHYVLIFKIDCALLLCVRRGGGGGGGGVYLCSSFGQPACVPSLVKR